jgi:membrane protease YdiL (CAAX protease family)
VGVSPATSAKRERSYHGDSGRIFRLSVVSRSDVGGDGLLFVLAYVAHFLPFSEIPFLLLFGWLSLWLRGIGWRAVGLKRPARWRKTLLPGIAVGVVYQFFTSYVIEPLIGLLTGKPTDLSQFTPIQGNVFLLCFYLLMAGTFAAFGEELIYRGYLMNRVAELGASSTPWAVSLVVVSVVFGVAHWQQGITGVVINIFAGVIYGALYLASGRNLWLPIIAHGVYDTVGLLLIFRGTFVSSA